MCVQSKLIYAQVMYDCAEFNIVIPAIVRNVCAPGLKGAINERIN